MPGDATKRIKMWMDKSEPLIFLFGANPHLRFARTCASDDPGPGFPVEYSAAKAVLKSGGYHIRGHLDTGRPIGNTGNNHVAEVWSQ
jgi:hypothetical protein